jgi:glucose/mannose-6-phosphate isomerase
VTTAGGSSSWLEHDSEQMLSATASLPEHIEIALGTKLGPFDPLRADTSSIVVLGMGGSSVAGSVLESLAAKRSSVPVISSSGYACPSFVDDRAVVFAVSFSGETEETLEATSTALSRGARVVALTGGGSLADLVADKGGEVISIQPGIPQPRAGVGAMVAPLLLVSEELGAVAGARRDLEQAVEQLRLRMPGLVAGGGPATEIARRIGRTIPIVHGASGLGAVAARRWKTQVNENAKAPAFTAEQPEVCHNEVCGFGQHGDVTRQVLTLVCLHLPGEHGQVTRRFRLVAEAVEEAVGDVVDVTGEGGGELAAFFDLVAIGDVMSLHLAAREGVDPGPVPVLTTLKQDLRDGPGI